MQIFQCIFLILLFTLSQFINSQILDYNYNNRMFYSNQLALDNSPSQAARLSKREIFRLEIRNRQIEQIKRQIRFKYYQLTDPNDYQLLRNINLIKVLADCRSYGLSQEDVHAMFLYASSKNSDHLFSLIDDKALDLLIQNLAQFYDMQNLGKNKSENSAKQVRWDRKIFWILTNYTSYSQIIHNQYLPKLCIIGKYLFKLQQPHPHLQQAQQNIILSLSNLLLSAKNCRYIIQECQQLFILVTNRMFDRKPSLSDLVTKPAEKIPKLVYYYSQLLHNLYTAIQYTQIQKPTQQYLIKLIIQLMSANLSKNKNTTPHIFMTQQDKKLMLINLDSICMLFGNSLDKNPEIIVWHSKDIKKIADIFEQFVKVQKQSAKSCEIIVGYLRFLRIVYGPNIPEDLQNKIGRFYIRHFLNHVGRVCQSMFLSNNPLFYTYTLKLLQSVLMQEYLAQQIFNQYLPIISHIFNHIKNSPYAIRKQALLCLVNLLKSTLYEQSSCAEQVLQILLANRISDVLACNLWAFVDNDLNLELLLGVEMLIQSERNQYGAKLKFWEMFQQAGGVLKMQKILQQSGNDLLKHQVCKIFQQVKIEDQPQL